MNRKALRRLDAAIAKLKRFSPAWRELAAVRRDAYEATGVAMTPRLKALALPRRWQLYVTNGARRAAEFNYGDGSLIARDGGAPRLVEWSEWEDAAATATTVYPDGPHFDDLPTPREAGLIATGNARTVRLTLVATLEDWTITRLGPAMMPAYSNRAYRARQVIRQLRALDRLPRIGV